MKLRVCIITTVASVALGSGLASPAAADATPQCNDGATAGSTECGSNSTTGNGNGANNTAVGFNASTSPALPGATGGYATAVGANAVSFSGSTATGADAAATGDGSTAYGFASAASGEASVALGVSAQASGRDSVALGRQSVADAANTVSVGSASLQRRIVNMAGGNIGSSSTDAVNGSQLFVTNQNVATAQGTANTALSNATTAQGTANAALSNAATAQESADTAFSNATTAQGTANTALSNAATAQGTANTARTEAAASQSTANTALSNAATAQTTANTARTEAATAQSMASTALTASNGFDSRITSLEGNLAGVRSDLRKTDRMASRGVAIASAFASVPAMESGKSFGIGVGVGSYNSATAFSIAAGARVSDGAEFRINVGTAGNGKVAVGGGGMFSW